MEEMGDGISPDEKVKMRTPEKLIESKEMARLQKMTSRLGISPDDKAKIREKAKNTMKILRDSMSPDEKAKMRKKETIGRKRLRLAKKL
jgi:hypothetical protein